MTEKNSNARIKPIVDGIKRSKEKLKAVVYSDEGGEIKILCEKTVDQDELDLDLKMGIKDLPETVKLAVVPDKVKQRTPLQAAGHVRAVCRHSKSNKFICLYASFSSGDP